MKKRGAIYSVVALMLCLAVYLNWQYTSGAAGGDGYEAHGKVLGESVLVDGQSGTNGEAGKTDGSGQEAAGTGDYFSQARLSRQKARDEAINILNSTVENESTTEDAKTAANLEIKTMADSAVVESRIENLIIAKGYRDCVVFINGSGANVIVAQPEAGLQETDAAKIKDIVMSEAGINAEQIKIIPTDQ